MTEFDKKTGEKKEAALPLLFSLSPSTRNDRHVERNEA
jgi:hypothetical protein